MTARPPRRVASRKNLTGCLTSDLTGRRRSGTPQCSRQAWSLPAVRFLVRQHPPQVRFQVRQCGQTEGGRRAKGAPRGGAGGSSAVTREPRERASASLGGRQIHEPRQRRRRGRGVRAVAPRQRPGSGSGRRPAPGYWGGAKPWSTAYFAKLTMLETPSFWRIWTR